MHSLELANAVNIYVSATAVLTRNHLFGLNMFAIIGQPKRCALMQSYN